MHHVPFQGARQWLEGANAHVKGHFAEVDSPRLHGGDQAGSQMQSGRRGRNASGKAGEHSLIAILIGDVSFPPHVGRQGNAAEPVEDVAEQSHPAS